MRKTIGVIVGRFQVPELHEGHKHLIEEVMMQCDTLCIILGNSKQVDERNPYTAVERKRMISTFVGKHIMMFNEIEDCDSDKEWSRNLDHMLNMLSTIADVTLYGSRDSFIKNYTGNYPYEEIPELPGYSGTAMRAQLKKDAEQKSES